MQICQCQSAVWYFMKYLNFDKHLGAIDQQLDPGTGFFGRQASVST